MLLFKRLLAALLCATLLLAQGGLADSRSRVPVPLGGTRNTGLPAPAFAADLTTGSFPSWIISHTRSESVAVATYFDSGGNLQTAAINAARFGYDFFSGNPIGYISEAADTNLVRDNTMQGAVAGTPGTPPNNWSVVSNANGLSTQIVGVGTERNINTIDFRVFGTSANGSATQLYFEATNNIATTQNTFRSVSSYLSIRPPTLPATSSSATNVSNISLDIDQRDSGNNPLGIVAGLNINTNVLPSILSRFANNLGATAAGVAFSAPLLTVTPSGTGVAVDITIRVGMPSLGGFSTIIATTNAAVTRNADTAQFATAPAAILSSKVYAVTSSVNGAGNNGATSNSALIGGSAIGFGYISPNTIGTFGFANTGQGATNLVVGMTSSASARSVTNNGGALYDGSVTSDASPVAIGPFFGNLSNGFGAAGAIAFVKIWNTTFTNAQLQTATFPANATTAWGDSLSNGTGSVTPTVNGGYTGFLAALLGAQGHVYNKGFPGQGAAFIKNQMVADTKHTNDTIIIEIGRNDVGGATDVVALAQAMVAHLAPGNTRYVVLSIINNTAENSAASGTNLTNYNWIIAKNAALAAAFPSNYVDARSAIVSASGGANDAPAASYMYQASVHPNDAGYQVMATQIKNFGHTAGWPGY